jgi:hypothetical protein
MSFLSIHEGRERRPAMNLQEASAKLKELSGKNWCCATEELYAEGEETRHHASLFIANGNNEKGHLYVSAKTWEAAFAKMQERLGFPVCDTCHVQMDKVQVFRQGEPIQTYYQCPECKIAVYETESADPKADAPDTQTRIPQV